MKDITLHIYGGDEEMNNFLHMMAWIQVCKEVDHFDIFDVERFGRYTDLTVTALDDVEEFVEIKKKLADNFLERRIEPETFTF